MAKKAVRYSAGISFVLLCILAFCIFCICELSFEAVDNRSYTLYDNKGNLIAYTLSKDEYLRFKTDKNEVSKIYIDMLIANEDKNFYSHMGVDALSLFKALILNISNQKITSGGSTIAMQVAKRLSGHKKRSYLNKLKEVVQAVYLTVFYGRDEVLNLYLTLSPFGSNIEGVKAASLRWFNHLPDTLTPSEAALLTALPRAPELIRPDRHPDNALYYKNEVLKLCVKHGIITDEILNLSLKDKLADKLYSIDNFNLPVLNELIKKYKDKKDFYSNLDVRVMSLLREIALAFEKGKINDASLSVVILDNKTKKVTGILGSSNPVKSQLCLPFMKRSPGSALKPFIYALAMNEGKLHPDTILHDKKTLFGAWAPDNFDREFNGLVSARHALSNSLNLPAIEVLKLTGSDSFISSLNALESDLVRIKGPKADLSAALGSADISLFSLSKLYAMLNNDGLYNDYYLLKDESSSVKETRFVNKDAARAVFDILKSTKRPANAPNDSKVSYKTGTSFHFNDAIAAGSLDNLTVAVAIRYPENNANVSDTLYSGYKNAAPYLFEILKRLDKSSYKKEKIDSPLLRPVPKALIENRQSISGIIDRKRIFIDFPQNNDVITPNADGMIFIKYHGGDGRVFLNIDDYQTDKNYFYVEEEGFYRISIFDEKGHTDSVTFKVVFR